MWHRVKHCIWRYCHDVIEFWTESNVWLVIFAITAPAYVVGSLLGDLLLIVYFSAMIPIGVCLMASVFWIIDSIERGGRS